MTNEAITPIAPEFQAAEERERIRMAQLAFEAYAFMARANANNPKLRANPYFYNAMQSAKADFLERFGEL